MPYNRDAHHRRSVRLKEYDYAEPGGYFVTICTGDQACLFGEIVDGEMRLNEIGIIADRCWRAIPDHFAYALLDEYVIMPNHVHGIIVIAGDEFVGARHALPLQPIPMEFGKPPPRSLPSIVGSFKSATTKWVNRMRNTPGNSIWQRDYYEHVIRNEADLARIREYIVCNSGRWAEDENNPANLCRSGL